MSRVVKDVKTQQERVIIPRYKNLPPNPHIKTGPDTLTRALEAPSETETINDHPETKADKSLRHILLASDQRSFLTGSAAADLQVAHIINPVSTDTERKQNVEKILTRQRLHPPIMSEFVLDGPHNAILLEANLHIQWDLYATFCFVPTEKDAIDMLSNLRTSNKLWGQMHQRSLHFAFPMPFARPLDTSHATFSEPLWEIVVLQPHAMLPNNQPIAITETRNLYSSGGPLPPTSWKFWTASGDCLFSSQQPGEYFEAFAATNLRHEYFIPPISSLAMVVNAHCKLKQFMEVNSDSASERVKRIAKLMSDIVFEIFFMPEGDLADVVISGPSQLKTPNSTTTENVNPPHLATPTAAPSPTASQVEPGGRVSSATEKATDPNLLGAKEAPETPNTDDGLTNSEFKLLSSKANDPHIDAKERADAAMMMIFGARRYPKPYILEKKPSNE